MIDSFLSLRQVERRLSLSRWTLYEMIHSGRLEAVKLPSGHYRVPERAVDAIMQGSTGRSGDGLPNTGIVG